MPPEGTLPSSIISLPQGGGALHGIGEKFSPDLFTGTGNFTVPIALPPGRNGFQPQLNLVYSSGNGNGPFGLGWNLNIPGVSRKTSNGVPLYNEAQSELREGKRRDIFILSGAEDLVPVNGSYPGIVTYHPRTEGLFAQIERHLVGGDDYWLVKSKDGLASTYGSPKPKDSGEDWHDTAVIKKPDTDKIFAWKLTETKDPFGNLIRYEYERDNGEKDGHRWDQPLVRYVRYVDYGEATDLHFLVQVEFVYDTAERSDPFSDYRAGFEIRTTKLCKSINISTHTNNGQTHNVREYRFDYDNDPYNGVSLLQQMEIIGYDDDGKGKPYDADDPNNKYAKQLPPLTFGYTGFAPDKRKFEIVSGNDLPARALSSPELELVDLFGSGLPDILEMNGFVRYWRNLGNGRFDLPRPMRDAPSHALADPGVQMIDANGDGRTDLLVTQGILSGYYPIQFGGKWSRESFRKYDSPPSFNLKDPEVRLIDLTGDGVTDIIRSGSRLECFFNHPTQGWLPDNTRWLERQSLEFFPNINFSDPRVKLADMNGDGLQDIVLVHDGKVEYWPNFGYGEWGKRISMKHGPRFPYNYDPQHILIGDVDGDGLADIVYVDHNQVLLWLNHSGNGWRNGPIIIHGTPPYTSADHVRLVDLHGTGVSGVLWSTDATSVRRQHLMFLDFTGGVKPYVLDEMDNHMGAVTRVEYRPSTSYYLDDQKNPRSRWRTPLPFPVQVVAKVEAIDQVSRGKLTTEYRYHHGYWDGAEREFRGFGMVEQLDTETFETYREGGLHGDPTGFQEVSKIHFSPPTLTKTWFHQGPVGEEFGDWAETDYTDEYWQGDPQLLADTEQVNNFLKNYNDRLGQTPSLKNRRIKRDALRTLRGSILRTELYGLDCNTRLLDDGEIQDRPYTVTEHAYSLEEIAPPDDGNHERSRIFFPHLIAQRTTQWERGDDPMTQFSITDYKDFDKFDPLGRPHRQTTVVMPRLRGKDNTVTGVVVGAINPNETRILASHTHTSYADLAGETYIHDRVSQVKTYELTNPPEGPDLAGGLMIALAKQRMAAQDVHQHFQTSSAAGVQLIGHQINHYDGYDFEGLPAGELGAHGALIRTEALVFTDQILTQSYTKPNDDRRAEYLEGTAQHLINAPANLGENIGYRKKVGGAVYEAGYYADTLRRQISARGMTLATTDSLSNQTVIEYDRHELLPVGVTDAANLKTSAAYNWRVLQPASLTEPNGNSTQVVYSPNGLPKIQFVVGLDASGNSLGGSKEKPEITFEYDFLNFDRSRKPIFVHTSRRVHHVRDGLSDDEIQTREYSDGYNRLIQAKAQAEDLAFGELGDEVGLASTAGVVPGAATATELFDRTVVSGWQMFDNKGRVVEKYEPFFDRGWEFQSDAKKGQHAAMFYDPRGQLVRTLNPDGSQQRVIFGAPRNANELHLTKIDLASIDIPNSFDPTPWENYTYDANDLASITHPGNTVVPGSHNFTPSSVVLDGMGRTRCAVARNGPSAAQDWFVTRSDFDIRGNLLTITDALDRPAFRHEYDLLNRVLSVDSIDAGWRTSVFDAQGNLIEYRDSKGSVVLRSYDKLNRPKELWARNDAAGKFTLRERIEYGDEGAEEDRTLARQHNTLGKPLKHYDEAGLLETPEYDFKGNLLEKRRRTIRDDLLANEWQADWAGNAEDALETTTYQTNSRFDALNRPIEVVYPQDVDGTRRKLTPGYNRAGALEGVKLDDAEFVKHIAYNAKGQRVLIAYGNGLMTRQAYDLLTFRLSRLRTENFTHPQNDRLMFQSNGGLLQDYSYSYDFAGNIVNIDERTPHCGFRANTNAFGAADAEISGLLLAGDALIRHFEYDPIYRLTSATGRACQNTAPPRGLDDDPRCGFRQAAPAATPDNAHEVTEGYLERYSYDPAGNMLELSHQAASSGTWKRVFGMGHLPNDRWQEALNNRLTSLKNGADVHSYQFDDNGNLTQQNTERLHAWDHADRMIGYRVQTQDGSATSVRARYLYGSDGMRVKKYVRNQQGQVNVTVYVDGLFEHHRQVDNSGTLENNSLHVMDNQSRIAIMRVGAPLDARDASPTVAYHLGDHLGSSAVVVGGEDSAGGAFINREEFLPYGETSFGSFGKKRYRYSGKERDEESELYYFGERLYMPALAKWASPDPISYRPEHSERDLDCHSLSRSLYLYCADNPCNFVDPDGMEEMEQVARVESDSIRFEANELLISNTGEKLDTTEPRLKQISAQIDIAKKDPVNKDKKIELENMDKVRLFDSPLEAFDAVAEGLLELTMKSAYAIETNERGEKVQRERSEYSVFIVQLQRNGKSQYAVTRALQGYHQLKKGHGAVDVSSLRRLINHVPGLSIYGQIHTHPPHSGKQFSEGQLSDPDISSLKRGTYGVESFVITNWGVVTRATIDKNNKVKTGTIYRSGLWRPNSDMNPVSAQPRYR